MVRSKGGLLGHPRVSEVRQHGPKVGYAHPLNTSCEYVKFKTRQSQYLEACHTIGSWHGGSGGAMA